MRTPSMAPAAAFLLASSLFPVFPVSAQNPAEPFAVADRNSDGFIDRGEFYQRMVEVFFFADRNRDGRLVPAELLGVPAPLFAGADRDHDGALGLA